jgi:hypothetical protein
MPSRWIALVGLLLLIQLGLPSHAQPLAYDGLDVLFLVDQSGSMGGRAFNHDATPNDPLGLRFEAVQYALRTLAEYRRVVPQQSVFRMGVVSFGDETEVTLPWIIIPQENAALDPLLNQLSGDSFGGRNLGNTNFVAAYQEAERQFAGLPIDENHLRVIIILTDGAPCAPALFSDRNCTTPSDQNQHMDEVTTLVNRAFPASNYRLFAIAIDNRDEFWDRFSVYWERIVRETGAATRVANSTDVGQTFLEILAQVVEALRSNASESTTGDVIGRPVDVNEQNAVIDVPPYYQSMRITVFKTQPIASIAITDPLGTTFNEASPQVTVTGVNGAIETWTIDNPQPGRWRIITTLETNLLDIYLDLIRVTYDIDVPDTGFVRYVGFPVTLRILDSDGNALPNYADERYRLNVEATLRTPNGVQGQFELAPSGQNEYTGQLLPEQAGTYALDLLATTRDVDGNLITVIEVPDAAIFEVAPLDLNASMEPQGDILMSESVKVTASLSSGGATLTPSDLVIDTIVRGGVSDLSFRLLPDETGGYTGTLVMENQGQFQFIVQAKRTFADGTEIVLDEEVLPLFRVNAANFVALRIVRPQPQEIQYTTGGFPPLTPVDLVVEVQTTGASGELLELESLTSGSDLPIRLSVLDENDQELASGRAFTSETPGVYRLNIPDLGTGEFRISVNADTSTRLNASTLFDPRFTQQSVIIRRETNPALIGFVVVTGIAVIGIAAGSIFLVLRTIRLRKHPARGRLVIFSEDFSQPGFERAQVWSYTLDRDHKNYIVINRPPLGLKRIIVECTSDTMARQNQVLITVETTSRKELSHQPFRPGTERRLDSISTDTNIYTLAKDPDSYNI